MTTQRVIVLCAPTSRLDTSAAELFVVEPASRQRPVRAIGARLASRREGSVITTFSLAPSVGEVMSEHFFGRKVSEEKNEDGQFELTLEIDEQVRDGVRKRKALVKLAFDTKARATETGVEWTDERLERLAAFF